MPAQPSPPSDNVPIWQKLEAMQWWAKYPALTLMVFLRQDLGYRTVGPLVLFGTGLFMTLLAGMAKPANRPDDLILFIIAFITMGLFQRYNRWQSLRHGEQHHSLYIGTSILDRLRGPEWFRFERRVSRLIDPAVCFCIGVLLLPLSPIFGRWIIFAALCLAVFEQAVFRSEFRNVLDTVDGLVNSELQGEIVDLYSPDIEKQRNQSAKIPTGLGRDIKERIRNARRPLD